MNLAKLLRSLHFSDKAELVMTTHYYEPPSKHQDKEFKGDVSAAYAWATQVVEVEVDTETGVVKLVKVTGAHDVGRVLNRLGIEGQIEGGIVMGQGYAITEELIVEHGVVRNPGFRDYKLVTAPEIPEMDIHFIETMDGEGPQGAKGVGEAPAICMAAAIANAICNATGVRIYELPFTPEKVYRALHHPGATAADRGRLMRRRTVLSLEQALSLPYATLRFVQLGWRVIRIEATPSGEGLPGDPNRYIGRNAVDDDRRTYFIAPNVGKEAIALNLKEPRGQQTLAAPGRRARRRRVLLQRDPAPLSGARHRLRHVVRRQARPHLGRNLRARARTSGRAGLRPGAAGDGGLHGDHRRPGRARRW